MFIYSVKPQGRNLSLRIKKRNNQSKTNQEYVHLVIDAKMQYATAWRPINIQNVSITVHYRNLAIL